MKDNLLVTGKTSQKLEEYYLPLLWHLQDTAGVMNYLVNNWVSYAFFREIGLKRSECKKLITFLAFTHDLGKATPAFQDKILDKLPQVREKLNQDGFTIPRYEIKDPFYHAHAGAQLLRFLGCAESAAAIVGAHHGKPESVEGAGDQEDAAEDIKFNSKEYGSKSEKWKEFQKQIFEQALAFSGYKSADDVPEVPEPAQMLLTGLLIMADWIASNEAYFPLVSFNETTLIYDNDRVERAMERLELPDPLEVADYWKQEEFFADRFGFVPRNVQKETLKIIEKMDEPGLLILEAPMGNGKTEAALAAAEAMMNRYMLGGIAFFLPTQATTNAMFSRITAWINSLDDVNGVSIQLMHANAGLNDEFAKLREGGANIFEEDGDKMLVHAFFQGKKTKLLSNVAVGTIDQLLMAALRQKHVMLRHLGLSGKVVVIDECHAYDAYMNIYLDRALQWLGAYHIPVILLSATLPGKRREELIKAYAGKKACEERNISDNTAYPLLTMASGGNVQMKTILTGGVSREITIQKALDKDVLPLVGKVLDSGGCCGIILNTVKRVQEMAASIREAFPQAEIMLDHSQYLLPDRLAREEEIKKRIGKESDTESRRNVIVIGTQVLEQSLDIDFDLLITDLCPMDLLLQRIGRLQRHERIRPAELVNAECHVLNASETDLEDGAEAIYGAYLLRRTVSLLPNKLYLPEDISLLVQKTYNEEEGERQLPEEFHEFKLETKKKQQRAKRFCICTPDEEGIVGLLDDTVGFNDPQAQAAVRDGASSIEVIALGDCGDGRARILSGEQKGLLIRMDEEPSWEEALEIAKQQLRLPARFSRIWCAEKNISELEAFGQKTVPEWLNHPMLKGELIIILDKEGNYLINGMQLHYDEKKGLICEVKNNE